MAGNGICWLIIFLDCIETHSPENKNQVLLRREKPLTVLYANNKGADQPAHVRSLVSAFVCHSIETMMTPLKTQTFNLLSVAGQASFNLTWLETPEKGFLTPRTMRAIGGRMAVILMERGYCQFLTSST